MGIATVTWKLPTARQQGGPLPIEDILNTQVSISGDAGTNFAVFATLLPDAEQKAVISDLDPGEYVIRIVTTDKLNQPGAETDLPGVVDDRSPPAAVTDAVVTIS